MKNKTYAEVTSNRVNVYMQTKQKASSFAFPIEKNILTKSFTVVLVANVRQISVRVVDIPDRTKKEQRSLLRKLLMICAKSSSIKGLSATEKWNLVKQAYPIGEKMNETTHIFDGAVFANAKGVARFFIAALPIRVADEIGEMGSKLFGSPHNLKCLDTVEHFMCKHYSSQETGAFWVVFPQDNGVRILFFTDGLPRAVWYASSDPEFRIDEITRYFTSSINMLNKLQDGDLDDEYDDITLNELPKLQEKTTLKKVVVLNNGIDLDWLHNFLTECGVEVEKGEYCFGNLI